MRTLAITGANGYVGRHLIAHAVAQGWVVRGLVRSPQAADAVAQLGAQPHRVDALERRALAGAFQGASAIVHLAQIGAERNGATYDAVNVEGTRAVADAAQRAGVPRVVFLSGLGVARYGLSRYSTNRYFLSKWTAEVELFRSGREVVVFRPSYIVGPGDELIPALMQEMASGTVEIVGDGRYRLQPVAVKDAAEAILTACDADVVTRVIDLVGPEPLTYRHFVDRVARAARASGRAAEFVVREVPTAEAEAQAHREGYRGLRPDDLDVLLCDETSDPKPLEIFIGRPLTPLDNALAWAVAASALRSTGAFRS